MKVYDIITMFSYSQTHCVVAKNFGEAEKLFLEAYPDSTIVEIKVHSDCVEVSKEV